MMTWREYFESEMYTVSIPYPSWTAELILGPLTMPRNLDISKLTISLSFRTESQNGPSAEDDTRVQQRRNGIRRRGVTHPRHNADDTY